MSSADDDGPQLSRLETVGGDQAAVDLHGVGWSVLELPDQHSAGAEVIDGDLHSALAQSTLVLRVSVEADQ